MEALRDAPFEPNDLIFDDATRMYVITGPNMGGKSTFMRQNALIVLLASDESHFINGAVIAADDGFTV